MSAWTHQDIENLTVFYTTGLPIKEISKKMGRTPTALHKAISRFKLHPSRNLFSKTADNGLPKVPKNQRRHPSYLKDLFEKCFNEHWVTFDEVLNYLKEKKLHVTKLNQKSDTFETMYALKNKIFVASQILLIANKLRVEENQIPYKVESMSW
ncbi:MAG: hypothetical protein HEEMFOPI_01055 [Holosporales bacterium]